jgi:ketosteroid isomerase-like protein
MDNLNFTKAHNLFEKQIKCIMSDDRKAQMELYAEDLRYEFPFANDRPRLIESREAFLAVMTPLWKEAHQRGVKVIGCNHEFHATDEIDLFVAVFVLEVIATGNTRSLPFVQLIRIRDDLIVEVREYFSPSRRQEVIDQHLEAKT